MRPTDLKFRHPREKTPDPYTCHLISNGSRLLEGKPNLKPTFSLAQRFKKPMSDNTGFWRGPGSYDLSYESIGSKKNKLGPVYRPFHGNRNLKNNGYYYSGNSLVYDPNIVLGRKRSDSYSMELGLLSKSRPTTASSKNYWPLFRRSNSPPQKMSPQAFS